MSINVMVVDDSAIIRGLITKTLEADSGISVVASASNGQMAINELARKKDHIDVIILDIEMPVMDGIEALPKLLEVKPSIKIIMASTLTTRNADISLHALRIGAVDYIGKPSTSEGPGAAVAFRQALKEKIKALFSAGGERGSGFITPRIANRSVTPVISSSNEQPLSLGTLGRSNKPKLRDSQLKKAEAVAIASSTGGPQALFQIMEELKHSLSNVPVFITQHMPKTFTGMLANHISRISPLVCKEGENGLPVSSGFIYLAPGDYHMRIKRQVGKHVITLDQEPPINFCRPAADPMIESLSQIYGNKLLIAVLTGMGSDGLNGCRKAVERGATVIAQDEKSSIVWGMPGAVAKDGLCHQILPLKDIASFIKGKL